MSICTNIKHMCLQNLMERMFDSIDVSSVLGSLMKCRRVYISSTLFLAIIVANYASCVRFIWTNVPLFLLFLRSLSVSLQ